MKPLRLDIEVDLDRGLASFFDFNGDTFGETEEDQRIINEQLRTMIGFKVGYPVVIFNEIHAGNGHFTIEFKAAT